MASYTFSIDAVPAQGGEVSLDGVNYQASVTSTVTTITDRTLYARAANGWRFKWFSIGAQNFTANPYHYGYQDEGYVVAYAVFEQLTTYTITTAISPAGGGTTTGAGTYAAEASCTLTATPAAGYTFVRWEKNGQQVSTSASYTFTVSESATYTAVFATGVTVTLVATTFGRVRFEGDPAVHGTVAKSFVPGELVTIEAVTEYGSIFKQWRESYSGTVLTDARLIIFANDYIWTATFYHLYTVHARLAADIDTPCPNGQVRVVATETTTAWGRDVRYEKIEAQTLTIEQRSTGGGWAFVKWRYYSRYYERWYENADATLRLVNYGYDIYALFERTPTHLLVNSSTKESPAKLVYDPATNLLVSDY